MSARPARAHAGVIGDPIEQSLSPRLHAAAYAALGLDWSYGAFRVAPQALRAALAGAQALGFVGLSVTMPHKTAVARLCDQASAVVELLGAANTVSFEGGVAIAANTDGEGLLEDLHEGAGFQPAGASCAVIGAGGAGRAVLLALFRAGAGEILVVNRSAQHAAEAVELAPGIGRLGSLEDLGQCELVVNATPLAMLTRGSSEPATDWPPGGEDPAVALAAPLRSGQLVVDLVYRPAETAFLSAAAARGARTRGGLGMLVCQAARQVELWTGAEAPRAAMWAAVADEARPGEGPRAPGGRAAGR